MSDVKFIHVRAHDKEGKVLAKGGATIAYLFDEKSKTVTYDAAYCNSKEHYNKAIGRQVSRGRLLKGIEVSVLPVPEGKSPVDAIINSVWG